MTIHARDLPVRPWATPARDQDRDHRRRGRPAARVLRSRRLHPARRASRRVQLPFTTTKVIVARAFPPPGAAWKYANLPFDPEDSRPRDARRRHRGRGREHACERDADQRDRPRLHRQLQALTIPTAAGLGLNGNAPEIVAAIEAAVADGLDVINLSIGEPEIESSRDLVALALDAADGRGVAAVVTATTSRSWSRFGGLSGRGGTRSPSGRRRRNDAGDRRPSSAGPTRSPWPEARHHRSRHLDCSRRSPAAGASPPEPRHQRHRTSQVQVHSSSSGTPTQPCAGQGRAHHQPHDRWDPRRGRRPEHAATAWSHRPPPSTPVIRATPTAVCVGLVPAETMAEPEGIGRQGRRGRCRPSSRLRVQWSGKGMRLRGWSVPPTITVPGPLPWF